MLLRHRGQLTQIYLRFFLQTYRKPVEPCTCIASLWKMQVCFQVGGGIP